MDKDLHVRADLPRRSSNTSRHLPKSWKIKPEIAFDLSDNAELAALLKYTFPVLLNERQEDLLAFFDQPCCDRRVVPTMWHPVGTCRHNIISGNTNAATMTLASKCIERVLAAHTSAASVVPGSVPAPPC